MQVHKNFSSVCINLILKYLKCINKVKKTCKMLVLFLRTLIVQHYACTCSTVLFSLFPLEVSYLSLQIQGCKHLLKHVIISSSPFYGFVLYKRIVGNDIFITIRKQNSSLLEFIIESYHRYHGKTCGLVATDNLCNINRYNLCQINRYN